MDLDDSARLAARLYFYNRVPLSPRLSRELPTEDAVAKHLGLDSGGLPRGASGASWTLLAPTPGNEGWRTFVLRDPGRGPQNLGFKLYVSPQCEHLADAVRATASVLGRRRAARFKVGRDLAGIVRPDKLVAYFSQLEELTETADELLVRLRGMPVHGVPFTSEIGGSGLLSWGMDPPRELQVLDWQTLTSWRVWLVGRLAVALLAARAYAGSLPPWQFAIDRVRLEGVDPQTWTPQQSLWRGGS